ncbi:MAG: hypothetical protein WC289_04180 [Patescibacteria group bacterium]|jgi:hypothetical protein
MARQTPVAKLIHDRRGLSAIAVMIFSLLVLAVVLSNAIAITVNERGEQELAQAKEEGVRAVTSMCGERYHPSVPECTIVRAASCGQYFVIDSNCDDLDEVLLNARGAIMGTCSLAGSKLTREQCEKYLSPFTLQSCLMQRNLCQQ